ncbi:type IX secretion system sortase PorU [candidate division KSB1 bacterium]
MATIKSGIRTILLAALLYLPAPIAAQQDISVTEFDNGIIVTYSPMITMQTEISGGERITQLRLQNGASNDRPGEPIIPYRYLLFAIPENAHPTVTLIENDFETLNNVTLKNALGIVQSDSIFSQDAWINAEPVGNVTTGYFRLQRVIAVTINPVQYNPVRNAVKTSRNIQFRIDFNRPVSQAPPQSSVIPDRKSNSLYGALLQNYKSGEKWRRSIRKSSLRKRSQLSTGIWHTIPIQREGIYKITYQDLVTFGLNPADIDPRTVKIFNNGGTMLPEGLNEVRPEGLVENAIRVIGENDGIFDEDDYVLFYGKGTEFWGWYANRREIRHTKNVYDKTNLYWFSYGGQAGRRMQSQPYFDSGTAPLTTARGFVYREDELFKMYESGSDWYMAVMTPEGDHDYSVSLTGYLPGTSAQFRSAVYIAGYYSDPKAGSHNLRITADNDLILSKPLYNSSVLRESFVFPQTGSFTLTFENTSSSEYSELFLNWFEIEYERDLELRNGILQFQAPQTRGPAMFTLSGLENDNYEIYNVTDYENIYMLSGIFQSNEKTVTVSDTLRHDHVQYFAVDKSRYMPIDIMTPQQNTYLRSTPREADFIIITPGAFTEAARPLEQHHEMYDTLTTEIVALEDIYCEFSAGLQDPVAIRDFMKYAFENWTDSYSNPPRYLLLLGDGNYDYTGNKPSSEAIRVPPFQINNTTELVARVSDDFFGFLSGSDTMLDLAIGRLPVKTVEMTRNIVDKIIQYRTDPEFGTWRNSVTFVADDEITTYSTTESIHTEDTEELAEASFMPEYLNTSKIYLMDYPAVPNITSSSDRKPGAQDDLIERINEGTMLLTYLGHGNQRLLAHEWVLHRELDMPRIDNGRRLFFFYVASCAFGRWDLPNEDSMAELLLTKPDGGAIGIISAARDVFAHSNTALANGFFPKFMTAGRTTEAVGIALQLAKNLGGNPQNDQKYFVLGDPAIRLEFPKAIVDTLVMTPDSIKAMATMNVSGSFLSQSAFSGKVHLTVYDSEKEGTHTMSNGVVKRYQLPGSKIFYGSAPVLTKDNNQFSINYIVPRDISYGGTDARISVYAWNDEGDATAFLDDLPVGGTALVPVDNEGPEIEVWLNDRLFISGDMAIQNPELLLKLSDEQGINITGEVGHKIELNLNNNESITDLSKYFEYETGSYQSGDIRYTIRDLKNGHNTFSVRVWDNFNNSSMYKGIANIVGGDELIVDHILNYPNPFSEETQFTCQVNMPAEIEIKIYTVRARLVRTLSGLQILSSSFFVSPPWDGRDEDGDALANGTYLYKLIARTEFGTEMQQVEKTGKLVIMR